jgi:hypothetical protein
MRVSKQGLQKQATGSRTLSLYADSPCARMLDVMLSTAPCSVCDTIDMACVACADRMAGYCECRGWETSIERAQMSTKYRSKGFREEKKFRSIVVASTSKSRNVWCFQRVADVPDLGQRPHRIDVKSSLAAAPPPQPQLTAAATNMHIRPQEPICHWS